MKKDIVIGTKINIGGIPLVVTQTIKGPHGDLLDIVATSTGDRVHLESCTGNPETGKPCLDPLPTRHLGENAELDDPRLVFAVLLIHGCAGWFCPECFRLIEATPRTMFHPKARLKTY